MVSLPLRNIASPVLAVVDDILRWATRSRASNSVTEKGSDQDHPGEAKEDDLGRAELAFMKSRPHGDTSQQFSFCNPIRKGIKGVLRLTQAVLRLYKDVDC